MIRNAGLIKILASFVLIVGAVLMVSPLVWMLLTSFKMPFEAVQVPPTFLPQTFTFDNYVALFEKMHFWIYLRNTLIVVLWSFAGMFFNAMAGYAFAKYTFPGKNIFFVFVLATMMIPCQVTMIPVYLLINAMHLSNTLIGIVLPGLVSAFSIFLFREFMASIPNELIEAMRIDGASEFGIFLNLILPISKPILAVQGILTFIGGWNSFLWPLIIANDEKYYTLSVGLSLLQGENSVDFALQMAGASVMVVPIMIIFVLFQHQIMDGIHITGMK